MNRRLSIVLLVALSGSAAALAAVPVKESRPADPDGEVTVEILSGKVSVTGWDRNEVSVEGEIGDDVERLDVSSRPGRVSIRVEIPDGRGRRDLDARLSIRVPHGSGIEVSALSADVDVSETRGSVGVEVLSGDVTVKGEPREVEVDSASGDIRIDGPAGRIDVESVSGDIVLDGFSGRLAVESVSGDTTLRGTLTEAEISAVSGDVRFDGLLADGARLSVQSVSGDVELKLPADVSARFRVRTTSGRIDSAVGGSAVPVAEYGPGMKLDFTAAGGRASVDIESFSGNVHLRRR